MYGVGVGSVSWKVRAHVVGVFVDFSCLHQSPRTRLQDVDLSAALRVMMHGFASPLGTTVARFAYIPPCPAKHAQRSYDERGWCLVESAARLERANGAGSDLRCDH